MIPVWPSTLPQAPVRGSYTRTEADNVISSKMDTGPDKVRRRSTAGASPFSCAFVFDQEQLDEFVAFWKHDLMEGSLRFVMPLPEGSDGTIEARRTAPYKVSEYAPGYWQVSLELEVLP